MLQERLKSCKKGIKREIQLTQKKKLVKHSRTLRQIPKDSIHVLRNRIAILLINLEVTTVLMLIFRVHIPERRQDKHLEDM